MTGIIPLPVRPTGRKQWTLHDGPRSSLRRLRSQLAEDGCPESQVVLAKQLLEEMCDLDAEREENARLGVFWLVKASEQGNVEATDILKQCLDSGQGVTEHNYVDIQMCLSMAQDEKLVRRAAREMFSSLSDGQDFITTTQLERQIMLTRRRSGVNPTEQKSLEGRDAETEGAGCDRGWTARGPTDKVTEDHLVSAASNYVRGELPLVHRVLALEDPSLGKLYRELLQRLVSTCSALLGSLLPLALTNLQTFLLLLLYSALNADSVLLLLPVALYYVSLLVMVVATLRMLQSRHRFRDFRVWSQLFLSYGGGGFNPAEAEYRHRTANLRPYAHFFLALLTHLSVHPWVSPRWTPQAELATVALVLTLATLVNFMEEPGRRPDLLVLASLAVHVLARYPYEADTVVGQGWRFLDARVPTMASYVVGNGVEFCLNFRAVFYLLIPAISARLAARDGWRGIYTVLVPHCVTLAWWQLAVIASQGATWYGLIRGCLALVGVVVLLPLCGLATVLLPVAAVGNWLADANLGLAVAVLGLALVWWLGIVRRMRVVFALAVATVLLLPLLWAPVPPQPSDGSYPSLSWEQYQNQCHQPAWEQSSVAVVQLHCSHLADTPVSWDGYVTGVRLRSLRNPLATLLGLLPSGLGDALTCWAGDKLRANCEGPGTEHGRCGDLNLGEDKCHLESWNWYEFEVSVRMRSGMWGTGATVFLVADDSFRNFTLALRPGDRVWFAGSLANGPGDRILGGADPQVQLLEIGCLGCHRSGLQIHRRTEAAGSLLDLLHRGAKSILNFVFNPLVIFK